MLKKPYTLAIHGGCGDVIKENFTPEQEEAYLAALKTALQAGETLLKAGKSSMDAVEEAIRLMEDSPLFNAGKGSVFTHEGKHEMDASIMDGATLEAGAVAGMFQVQNPILAARAVKDHSTHVLLSGQGAETFAGEQSLRQAEQDYFYNEQRWQQYQKALANDQQFMDHASGDEKHGTVGAVALDQAGNLASGSSTGGITNKKHGRIGDSPIIGAGIYANNQTCAVSCTGEGEYFMRQVTAHTVANLMEYRQESLANAANKALEKVGAIGGQGGIVAVDRSGNVAMPFITQGMYRGMVSNKSAPFTSMFRE